MSAKILPAWEPYRPSNGTEGRMFMAEWCWKCARDAGHNCAILARTLALDEDDPEYPKEWIKQADDADCPGSARCTAFVPLSELSNRAKRAWSTRRKATSDAHAGDLFAAPTRED